MDLAIASCLTKAARKSDHRAFQHVAIVQRGGAIVSIAHNYNWTHAEVRALAKLWPSKRVGTRIISLRITKGGKLAMAKPCKACMEYMLQAGVKSVVYSDSSGVLRKIRL